MNYIERITIASKKHPELFRGDLPKCHISHDSDCPASNGKPCCVCNPDMHLTCDMGEFTVSEEGDCEKVEL